MENKSKINEKLNTPPRDWLYGLTQLPWRPIATPGLRQTPGGYGHVSSAAGSVDVRGTSVLLQEQVRRRQGYGAEGCLHPGQMFLRRSFLLTKFPNQ